MSKKICAIDFDETLSIPSIQEYAKMLIEKGIEVWIVTSRYDSVEKYTQEFLDKYNIPLKNLSELHEELFKVSDSLGIDREHIVFTNMIPKHTYFADHPEFIWHLDDSMEETKCINGNTDVKGICWMGNKNWRVDCAKLLFD